VERLWNLNLKAEAPAAAARPGKQGINGFQRAEAL
jgi:hypothetical protein